MCQLLSSIQRQLCTTIKPSVSRVAARQQGGTPDEIIVTLSEIHLVAAQLQQHLPAE